MNVYAERYAEKLTNPKWQKKRLRILERAGWKCESCGDSEESLQVHHLVYSKGEPWDAPDHPQGRQAHGSYGVIRFGVEVEGRSCSLASVVGTSRASVHFKPYCRRHAFKSLANRR
jgi:hypothetical protein